MRLLAAAGGIGAVLVGVLFTPAVQGDSFNPVRLAITVARVARLHKPLETKVVVSADAGVLDTATAPLRMRVRLARECGGTFSSTPGPVLLDKVLRPQPSTGRPFRATARGSGRPTTYGLKTVCAFLEEEGDNRMFANDTADPPKVLVSKRCTAAAHRYDVARRAGDLSLARADRRAARRACGPGVRL